MTANQAEIFSTELNREGILLNQSKWVEGEQILRDLIPRMRARLKPDDPLLAIGLTSRANALRDLHRSAEAEPLNAEAIEILRKSLPADHPQLVNTEAVHAYLCLDNGKPIEAEKLAAHVIEIRSRPGAVVSPAVLGSIRSALGGALSAQKKFKDAEPLLLEGFLAIEADPKAFKRRRDDALERLIEHYQASGKPDEADTWRRRRKPPATR